MAHEEYPKVLRHPAYKPARKIADAVQGAPGGINLGFGSPEQWEPEKWPAVTVTTADQEEYYAANGYKPAGMSDPAAFSAARASPFVPGRTVSEYPKMVNGVLVQDPSAPVSSFQKYPMYMQPPNGGEAVLVETEAQEQELLARWTDPDAKGPRDAVASDFEFIPEPRTLKLKKSDSHAE